MTSEDSSSRPTPTTEARTTDRRIFDDVIGDTSRAARSMARVLPPNAKAKDDEREDESGNANATTRARTNANAKGNGLRINPFKVPPKPSSAFASNAREMLRHAMECVSARRPTEVSHERLYREVENLCVHKYGNEAYGDFTRGAETRASAACESLDAKRVLGDHFVVLRDFDEAYGEYCAQALTLRGIFLYLDRTVASVGGGNEGRASLWDASLKLFHENLEKRPGVKTRVVRGLLHVIERERMGEHIDRALTKRVLRALQSLGVYGEAFEKVFIEASQEFYRKEGNEYSAQTDVSDYLKHCERRLSEEAERCANYLDASTARGLMRACEQGLIEAHIGDILDKGFADLMRQHRLDDLQRLHKLLARMDGLDRLCRAFVSYLKQQGTTIVKDEENDKDMVERLLAMKIAVDEIVVKAFGRTAADGSNDIFINGVKESFESFINCRQNIPAQLIAKYIDSKLKTGNRGGTEEELETTLDRALMIFRYISGKDVFEGFYKKELAKRLLHGKSASIDAEKAMISKLKAECGSQYTQQLEMMFKDVDYSREIMHAFRQSIEDNPSVPKGIETHVNVITSGSWPQYSPVDLKLPEQLATLQEQFQDFYLNKHSGRKLTWQNSQGLCVVKAQFANGPKELFVTLFSCVVLMLFNSKPKLTYREIAAASGLDDKHLRHTLQSLACGKTRILNKEPKSRDVEEGDAFEVNFALSERHFRIKINSIQVKEQAEENKQTLEKIFAGREHQCDAAIVRIMKTRKTLSHALLVSELLAQLKFPTKPSDLKKRIESLIEREYIERDREDPQKYNYLA